MLETHTSNVIGKAIVNKEQKWKSGEESELGLGRVRYEFHARFASRRAVCVIIAMCVYEDENRSARENATGQSEKGTISLFAISDVAKQSQSTVADIRYRKYSSASIDCSDRSYHSYLSKSTKLSNSLLGNIGKFCIETDDIAFATILPSMENST